jgi:hypothetical protein
MREAFAGGVVDVSDVAVHGALSLAVLTAGLTLAGVARESGSGAVAALVTTALAVPNLAPPGTFDEAAQEWHEVGKQLRGFHSELGNLVNSVAGGNDSWEGPGADAFFSYVSNKLLPAADQLALCAESAGNSCSQLSSSLTSAIQEYFATTTPRDCRLHRSQRR